MPYSSFGLVFFLTASLRKQSVPSISFTGEDFDIVDITDGKETDFVRVRGAMLHLPGKDKMIISSSSTGEKSVIMDRVMIAATPSYNLIRESDGTKIGWMEKKLISFTDSFDVYMEGKGGFGFTGLFKPTPAYRIEGDFLDRNFVFKNEGGSIVASANVDGKIFSCSEVICLLVSLLIVLLLQVGYSWI